MAENTVITAEKSGSAENPDDLRKALSSPEEIIAEIAKGRMVVLVDDEDRENEGDLIVAGEKATAEAINFMAKHGRDPPRRPLRPWE